MLWDNRLVGGGAGNDHALRRPPALDTAVYKHTPHRLQPIHGPPGRLQYQRPLKAQDAITGVERLQFSDKKIAMDLAPSEHAGQALEFIGVLAPSLVHVPSIVGVILGLIDGGTSFAGRVSARHRYWAGERHCGFKQRCSRGADGLPKRDRSRSGCGE
jgi:hypothetical protein